VQKFCTPEFASMMVLGVIELGKDATIMGACQGFDIFMHVKIMT
jgi:hypothetical protein